MGVGNLPSATAGGEISSQKREKYMEEIRIQVWAWGKAAEPGQCEHPVPVVVVLAHSSSLFRLTGNGSVAECSVRTGEAT